MKPVYEGNPKHKTPWQPGRKGSLCPSNISLERARQLLLSSIIEGRKRYGADQGRAFCAQQHDATKDRWHGYPIGWSEVPAGVRQQLVKAAVVTTRDIKRFWEGIQ
ncbi:MAG: hypothetical protein WCQ21_27115 [Verrucomicrobiota bacterium]